MASITYGWNLETIFQAFEIPNTFTTVHPYSYKEHRGKLKMAIELLWPKLEQYPGINIWLMCMQDSEVNLRESKMVGITSMVGGFVPELFWSLTPNEAVDDPLPKDDFISLIKFFTDCKVQGIDLPAPTIHFSGWHSEKLLLYPNDIWLD
jgi:hypothetical protein